MANKYLFKKKSINHKKYIILSLFIFPLIVYPIILFLNSKQKFFETPEFEGSFFIIPDDKGGTEVMNLDKKTLHLNDDRFSNIQITNDSLLEYSIQIFSSSNYHLVKKKLDIMINQNNKHTKNLSLKIDDFYIFVFNSNLGIEYMLLYKNFSTRISAFDYCSKNLNFIQKCLIVNAQNLI